MHLFQPCAEGSTELGLYQTCTSAYPFDTLVSFYASWKIFPKLNQALLNRFYASWKNFPEKKFLLLLCFLAFLFWKNQPLLHCFYASLKKFSEKIRFCFFDSTLLKKFSLKKSPSASSLLRFLAPLERITLCFIASSLLRFLRKTILEKNQPLLLCF